MDERATPSERTLRPLLEGAYLPRAVDAEPYAVTHDGEAACA
jgi:hypothetical protein